MLKTHICDYMCDFMNVQWQDLTEGLITANIVKRLFKLATITRVLWKYWWFLLLSVISYLQFILFSLFNSFQSFCPTIPLKLLPVRSPVNSMLLNLILVLNPHLTWPFSNIWHSWPLPPPWPTIVIEFKDIYSLLIFFLPYWLFL